MTVNVLRWEHLTKTAFDRLDRAQCIVVVTSSPLEVHGPHLPLAADIIEGEALADRTIARLREPHRSRTFLKLPFLYTAADALPQAGSIYFPPSTTERVLTDLGRSLAAQGFRDVVVSNFHGSPRHFLAIERACARVNRRFPAARMIPLFSLILGQLGGRSEGLANLFGDLPGVRRTDLEGDAHGGLVETSQLLALRPDLVEPSYRTLPRDVLMSDPSRRIGSIRQAWRGARAAVDFFRAKTYAGAPAGASAELGERMLEIFSARAAAAYADVLEGKISRDACHSPIWPMRFVFLNPLLVWIFDRLLGYAPPR